MGDRDTGRRDYESGATEMINDDYTSWGQDDTYVYTWLAGKLSLTIETLEEGNYWN
jgi:hypothetical protein